MLRRRRRTGDLTEYLLFNGKFNSVGEFVPVRAEQLDAIVLPGIVRGRDDDASGEPVRVCQKGDRRRRNDTGALYRRSPGGEACSKSCGDPFAGLASIHAEQNSRRWCLDGKSMGESKPNRIDGGRIERRLAGNGANTIGSKKLLHELLVSVTFASSIEVCFTSASSVP